MMQTDDKEQLENKLSTMFKESVIKHPMLYYNSINLDILNKVNNNARILAKSIAAIGLNLLTMIVCIATALLHIAMVVFYPLTKLIMLYKFRRAVMHSSIEVEEERTNEDVDGYYSGGD